MAKFNWKAVGLIATIAGAGLSLVSSMADEKTRADLIKKEIEEEFARRDKEKEEES